MLEYKTVADNKRAIRKFNYVIAKYKNKKVYGKVKSFKLAGSRNRISEIELDTKSIFKYIVPGDYDVIELYNKVGRVFESKITLRN